MAVTMTYDRPFWPPGPEIAEQAWDAYGVWETRWEDDLEGIDEPLERTRIYAHMVDGIDIDLAKAMARTVLNGELGKET